MDRRRGSIVVKGLYYAAMEIFQNVREMVEARKLWEYSKTLRHLL